MSNDEIFTELRKNLLLKNLPNISQKRLNELLSYCINNNEKELVWRLALTYSNSARYNFEKLVDYYVQEKDVYYLTELIYAVKDNVNLKDCYEKVIMTKDESFIKEVEEELSAYLVVNDKDELLKILEKNY